jgi:hypothetical protein
MNAMRLDTLKKKETGEDQINWVTASFMVLFHLGTVLLYVESTVRRNPSVVGFDEPGNWHGVSPAADASRLQDPQVGRTPSHRLRYPRPGRRPDLLGGHASYSPPIFRPGGRSTLTNRREVVGARWLDPGGQIYASRHNHTGSIRPRSRQGQISDLLYKPTPAYSVTLRRPCVCSIPHTSQKWRIAERPRRFAIFANCGG